MIGRQVSRRQFCLAGQFCLAALAARAARAVAQTDTDEISDAQRASLTSMASAFMGDCAVPGLSVAIAKHGKFSYRQAFGFADTRKKEPVGPSSLFRIASVSKPFTSAAIFTLVEQGKLVLDAKVFGAGCGAGYRLWQTAVQSGRGPYQHRASVDTYQRRLA